MKIMRYYIKEEGDWGFGREVFRTEYATEKEAKAEFTRMKKKYPYADITLVDGVEEAKKELTELEKQVEEIKKALKEIEEEKEND